MTNSPGPPRVWVWSSVGVDFTNQTSISNSKCYPDLEPTGRTECKWLTLFLSELPLQIPVTPWGCQNELNALYTKSWGRFFFFQPKTFMLLRVSSPSLRLGSRCASSQNICSRMQHHWELWDLLSILYPSVPLRGQENTPILKVPNAVYALT